jgi:hypothetical protein
MSAIASFSTVAVAAPTTATRSNVAKRYARILYDDETDDAKRTTTRRERHGSGAIDAGFAPSGWVRDGS